jgi:hypothetical protein
VIGDWGDGLGKLWLEEGEGVGKDGGWRIEMGVRVAIGEGQRLGVGGRALGTGGWQAERTRESNMGGIRAKGVR